MPSAPFFYVSPRYIPLMCASRLTCGRRCSLHSIYIEDSCQNEGGGSPIALYALCTYKRASLSRSHRSALLCSMRERRSSRQEWSESFCFNALKGGNYRLRNYDYRMVEARPVVKASLLSAILLFFEKDVSFREQSYRTIARKGPDVTREKKLDDHVALASFAGAEMYRA